MKLKTIYKCRGVAQLGSVSVWGTGGRWFKSSRPDHKFMEKKFRIFYTTADSKIDAQEIANYLLKNLKAFCVNIFDNVNSFYLENKKIKNHKEVVLFIKTFQKHNEIEKSIKEIHKYDTPIIVELKTDKPNQDYLNWFLNE